MDITNAEIKLSLVLQDTDVCEGITVTLLPSEEKITYKNYDSVMKYFSDVQKLIEAIKGYKRLVNQSKGVYSLLDLLKNQTTID